MESLPFTLTPAPSERQFSADKFTDSRVMQTTPVQEPGTSDFVLAYEADMGRPYLADMFGTILSNDARLPEDMKKINDWVIEHILSRKMDIRKSSYSRIVHEVMAEAGIDYDMAATFKVQALAKFMRTKRRI